MSEIRRKYDIPIHSPSGRRWGLLLFVSIHRVDDGE
jgi:hypothetical protein